MSVVGLREAAECVIAAKPSERAALLEDLAHERADCVYELRRAQLRVEICDLLLARIETISAEVVEP